MRETRSSGSVEGVMGNHDPYSDRHLLTVSATNRMSTRSAPLQ